VPTKAAAQCWQTIRRATREGHREAIWRGSTTSLFRRTWAHGARREGQGIDGTSSVSSSSPGGTEEPAVGMASNACIWASIPPARRFGASERCWTRTGFEFQPAARSGLSQVGLGRQQDQRKKGHSLVPSTQHQRSGRAAPCRTSTIGSGAPIPSSPRYTARTSSRAAG
jgi:hypothetical protein